MTINGIDFYFYFLFAHGYCLQTTVDFGILTCYFVDLLNKIACSSTFLRFPMMFYVYNYVKTENLLFHF